MGMHASTRSPQQRLREAARFTLQPMALLVLGVLAFAHLVAWLPLGTRPRARALLPLTIERTAAPDG